MGSYPRQNFIFGICYNTDLPEEEEDKFNEFEKFMEENDLDYSIAGNCCDGFQCGIVIGFEYKPKFEGLGYFGGYHVIPFSVEGISNWLLEVVSKMDEDLRHKIVKFMEKYYSITDKFSKKHFDTTPKLWTVSSFG